jgi:nucleotide-binding universal stress UspA family protein
MSGQRPARPDSIRHHVVNEFSAIVVGVDFSPPSAAALEEAGRLAAWEGAHLIIAHAFHDELLAAACRYTGLGPAEILAGRRMRLDRFCLETLGTRTVRSLELRVLKGHPFVQLIRLVEREEATLLVLGAQGESHRDARQLGTLASSCVRHAPCETLLVRAGHTGGFRRVVVTVDLSAGSRRAIRQAAEIVKADGGELHVLHVYAPAWKVSALANGEVVVSSAEVAAYVKRVERQVATFIHRELPDFAGLAARIAVRESYNRGNGILAYLNEVHADLVILGYRGQERLHPGHPGATTEHMIHDAPCSVLAVHPEEEPWHPAVGV